MRTIPPGHCPTVATAHELRERSSALWALRRTAHVTALCGSAQRNRKKTTTMQKDEERITGSESTCKWESMIRADACEPSTVHGQSVIHTPVPPAASGEE